MVWNTGWNMIEFTEGKQIIYQELLDIFLLKEDYEL